VRRLDEVKAARNPVVRYRFDEHPDLSAHAKKGEVEVLEAQKGA
jgi:hypothetical protein